MSVNSAVPIAPLTSRPEIQIPTARPSRFPCATRVTSAATGDWIMLMPAPATTSPATTTASPATTEPALPQRSF
jgi:hypothetical protein